MCTHGEEGDLNPAHELNYHVYAVLAEKADATPEEIAARSVGELYGDEELAAEASLVQWSAFPDLPMDNTDNPNRQ